MLPSFSADGVSRLQTFTLRFENMATGWENTAWFAVTPVHIPVFYSHRGRNYAV